MSQRKIFVTTQDRKRLGFIGQMVDASTDRRDLEDLAYELQQAEIVEPEAVPSDVITMNSRVRLTDLDKNETLEYTLVYPQEADYSKGKISIVAPVGAAMLGYRVGSNIEWTVPGGRRRLKVEALLYQPEAAGDYHL